MQTFRRGGSVALATFDDGAAAGCAACSYLEFEPPGAAGRRRLAASAATYALDVEVACVGGGSSCSWTFAYVLVYPPPPPAPPGPGPLLVRCLPAELPLAPYSLAAAQAAQGLLVAQLRAYAETPPASRPASGVVAQLWVGAQNVTAVLTFLERVVNTSYAANVRWWDACVERNAVAKVAITSLDQTRLTADSPEGVAALVSVVAAAVSGAAVPPLAGTQLDAVAALDMAASAGPSLVPDAAQCLTSSLSDLVAYALLSNNYALLPVIPPVLEHAANSQSAQMAQAAMPGRESSAVATTSPYIQTFVQADPRAAAAAAAVDADVQPWGVPAGQQIKPSSCMCSGCDYAKLRTRSVSWFNLSTLLLGAGSSPVVAQYFALDFDPYVAQFGFRMSVDGAATATYDSTGVSRMRLVDASTLQPVPLAELATPIAFEMPRVAGTGGGSDAQGRCGFWNAAAATYDTSGTATLPDPRPAAHDVAFADAPATPDDAALALAWSITGPLLANCTLALLDCAAPPTQRLRIQWAGEWGEYPHDVIYLDPWHPLDHPAVACPGAAAGSNLLAGGNVSAARLTATGAPPRLRVYYGAGCELWKPGNAANCSWDAVAQSFTGGGCVSGAVGEREQCLTRHLTDFTSARVPQISVCSVSDLASLTPADIWSKLRLLFYVVLAMFLAMNVGAAVGFFIDTAERRSVLARLRDARVGFAELPDGAMTWTCVQKQLMQDVQTPTGSAWELCAIFGMPFVRLRAALPEEFFVGSVGQAVGRRNLSLRGLADTKERNIEAMQQLMRDLGGCCTSAAAAAPRRRIPGMDDAESPTYAERDMEMQSYGLKRESAADAASALALRAPQQQKLPRRAGSPRRRALAQEAESDGARFVGSALVLAFLANANVMPSVELKRVRDVTTAHFAGVSLRGTDQSFGRLTALFAVLLSPGNLSSEAGWLLKARLWRLIFLQRADGGWDLTESLAFAVEAHAGERHKVPVSKAWRAVASFVRFIVPFLLDMDGELEDESEFDDTASQASIKRSSRAAKAPCGAKAASAGGVDDCPLTFSASAIAASIPDELLSLNNAVKPPQPSSRDGAQPVRSTHSGEPSSRQQPAPSRSASRDDSESAPQSRSAAAGHGARETAPLPPEQAWPALWPGERDDFWNLAPNTNPGLIEAYPVPGVTDSASSDRPWRPWSAVPVLTGGLQHLTVVDEQWLPPPPPVAVPRRAHSAPAGRPPVPVERIWATVIALSVLERLDISWLVDEERTVVDAGREWLDAQGRADHRVRRLLRSKMLQRHAERTIKRWQAVLSYHIGLVRGENVISAYNALKHFQRASMKVMLALMTQHPVLATFLDTEAVLKRWQRWMVLVTLLLTSLLTAIWFYSSRASSCCAEVRAILNLAGSVCAEGALCRGVDADCADLLAQFADVQGPYWYSDGPGETSSEHMYLDDYGAWSFALLLSRAVLTRAFCTQSATPSPTTRTSRTSSSWASSAPPWRGPCAGSCSDCSRRPTSATTTCSTRGWWRPAGCWSRRCSVPRRTAAGTSPASTPPRRWCAGWRATRATRRPDTPPRLRRSTAPPARSRPSRSRRLRRPARSTSTVATR
jgi:hypothetical protein